VQSNTAKFTKGSTLVLKCSNPGAKAGWAILGKGRVLGSWIRK
jgi:hypothetical protein